MKLFSVYFILMALVLSCSNTKKTTQTTENNNQKAVVATEQKEDNFYGFKFNKPKDWKETVSNFKAVDLQGQVKTIETDYQLNENDILRLVYHPGKSGIKLFNNYRTRKSKNNVFNFNF